MRGIAILAAALGCASLGIGQTKSPAVSTKGTAASTKATATRPVAAKSSNSKAVPAKANPVSTKTGGAKPAVTKSAAGTAKAGVRTASHATPPGTASATGKAPPKRAGTRVATHVAPHYAQQQPTPDRYREIQQALADKGYFHGSVDGTWGADSTDALKRFQTDQNVDADGKISALSLIALGLGPRRDSAAIRPAPSPDRGSEPSLQPVPEPAQAAPVAVP